MEVLSFVMGVGAMYVRSVFTAKDQQVLLLLERKALALLSKTPNKFFPEHSLRIAEIYVVEGSVQLDALTCFRNNEPSFSKALCFEERRGV